MNEKTSSKRIALITGANGFIGRHLARHLDENNYFVVGLGHGTWPDSEARYWGIRAWFNGDVSANSLRIIKMSQQRIDVVFHLAGGSSVFSALKNPREDFRRTVESTADLLEWMRVDASETLLVAVSSAAVYGAGYIGPIPECATLHPYSTYGHHKRVMENLCHSYATGYGVKVAIARLFSVYGSMLRKQLLWDLCRRLADGVDPITLGGTGDELRDWIDVSDVVRALLMLDEQASNKVPVFNVGSGKATSVRDVASLVSRCWATGGDPSAISFNGQARSGDPFSLVAESSSINSLGFNLSIDLSFGIADYVDWFRRHEAMKL